MRRLFLLFGVLLSTLISAQEGDTLLIRPVDSTVNVFLAVLDSLPTEPFSPNCHAAFGPEERSIYLRCSKTQEAQDVVVQYSIGRDTLFDLVTVSDTGWMLVKNFPLLADDTLCASLLDSTIDAEWSFRREGIEPVVQNEDFREFTGDIWYYKDVALLRIEKTRDYPEKMNIVVGLQRGFDLDRLFLKVKLIHPTEGVKEVEKEVRVADADELGKTDRLLRVYIPEWTLTEKGRYFLRISHQHYADRLNGIDFVSYEMLTP
ncbi:hypothetical protein HZ996_10850 [Cryomorphaceae bacterium]|nr:hypothetical protein HZ996_10850 [Cryomorphaceae bacterium]